ncbi:tail fiber protein [Yersinia intermedia]|uniref:phage tail-collar fiber domain-containing protein n=1 Tax=Yersinia intermedia TaxID=631 RepID=UPI0005DFEBEF|nr:phage tail protein [Yersinia intermedia]CQJ57440.1 tail fiber protein [Yersinia intermedia]
MATAITRAFEHWQAQQILNNLPARPDTVIFAHIPGLDTNAEIDRDEGIPDKSLIVHTEAVAQYGVINDSAVAYSVVLDTRVGDFSFNWIGLVDSASNTLCMIVHNVLQQKIATSGGVQGNNITRTFVMEFDGAAEASQINITAQTWQIDFSARLSGIDEITRLANYDYYGDAAFFADGFSVSKEADKYRVNPGLAYIGGIRALLIDATSLAASKNNTIYADISFQGSVLGKFKAIIHIGVKNNAADLVNYQDPNGFMHYVAPLATITTNGVEDKRAANPSDKSIENINAALAAHEKSRNHLDATTKLKGFTQLDSSVNSNSESLAATPKAVKTVNDAVAKVVNDLSVNGIGLLSMTGIDNFDFQTFVFTSGANYIASSTNWLNVPTEISYPAGLAISIKVDYVTGTQIGLEIKPSTVSSSNFRAWYLRLGGYPGSRTFTAREIQTSANPVSISCGGTGATTVAGALAGLGLTAIGIGLPTQTDIQNFDWQNFVFTAGANYVTSYSTWVNSPDGVTYNAGTRVSIRVIYISSTNGSRMGLELTPDTGADANFKVYELLCVGAAGSRVFTFRQDWNSANPIPITGGGTGATTVAGAIANLGLGDGSLVPIGIPLPYPLATPPAGFLKVNGSSFSTTTYPKLALAYPSGVLPDMRGNAIRAWDDGRGIDAGRALLSEQLDALQNITGNFYLGGSKQAAGVAATGAFGPMEVYNALGNQATSAGNIGGITFDASRVARAATETRMRNIAFNYIVRAL